MLCRAMSGFYEVTAASGYGGGGRRIRSKARFGQHSRESSRRQPHPRQGVGRHRPVAFCARPYGLATKATRLSHSKKSAGTTTLHSTLTLTLCGDRGASARAYGEGLGQAVTTGRCWDDLP